MIKFPTKQYTIFPSHLKYVAALPQETVALKLRHCKYGLTILIKHLCQLKG